MKGASLIIKRISQPAHRVLLTVLTALLFATSALQLFWPRWLILKLLGLGELVNHEGVAWRPLTYAEMEVFHHLGAGLKLFWLLQLAQVLLLNRYANACYEHTQDMVYARFLGVSLCFAVLYGIYSLYALIGLLTPGGLLG